MVAARVRVMGLGWNADHLNPPGQGEGVGAEREGMAAAFITVQVQGLRESGLGQIVDNGAGADDPDLNGGRHLAGDHEILVQVDHFEGHADGGFGALLTADCEPEGNGQKDGKEFQEPIAF